jgi:hypothetical protein
MTAVGKMVNGMDMESSLDLHKEEHIKADLRLVWNMVMRLFAEENLMGDITKEEFDKVYGMVTET